MPTYDEVGQWVARGLLLAEGDQWRQQRRTLAPLFTRQALDAYVPMMAAEAAALVFAWRHAAASDTVVDLHRAMTGLTLQVIGRALFGSDLTEMANVVTQAFPVSPAPLRPGRQAGRRLEVGGERSGAADVRVRSRAGGGRPNHGSRARSNDDGCRARR